MTRVVLIRHGESACNVAGVVGGHDGCTGLTPTGLRQVEQLRDRLASTSELESAVALYTSRLARAIQTAEVITPVVGGGSHQAISSCSLCELHPGLADGLTWDECRSNYGEPDWEHDPSAAVSPGGETWAGFVERASAAVQGLADSHEGGLVVVVCHGGVIEATMLSFLPIPNRNKPFDLPTTYTSITEWERRRSDWRLVRYNDVAHLGGPYEAQRSGPHEALRGTGSVRSQPQQA